MGGALTREAISTNYTITQIHPCQCFQLQVAVIKSHVSDVIHLPDLRVGISLRLF